MKNVLLLCLFLIGTCTVSLKGQDLVQSDFLANMSKEELSAIIGIAVPYDVDLYKIEYTTLDVEERLDTASGLLVLPTDRDLRFPMLCYQHGTVGSKDDVPSNLQGGYILAAVFGAMGYITVAPDFLGLGESRGFHPYVHADSEASAAVDMLRAVRQYAANNDVAHNDQLFVTGYSQGGHAAMALHRSLELEHNDEFTVTASAPMSGPYSISEKMKEFTLGDAEYFFVAYLAYVALSYQRAYGDILESNELSTFFKQPYANQIARFRDGEIDLWALNSFLIDQLVADFGKSVPKMMIQDDVLDALFNDPDHPVNVALRDNDVYDWAPSVPTRLFYCMNDDQVFFENSILAEEVMRNNGAPNVIAVDVDPSQDHGGCVLPAATSTLVLFNVLRQITTSTDDVDIQDHRTLAVFPNPVRDYLRVRHLGPDVLRDVRWYIRDVQDRLVHSGHFLVLQEESIDVSHLPTGLYTVQWIHADIQYTSKMVVGR